ncbi:tRNA (guanosine(46)-N7)-methyltransferase TrmB [Anaerosacchariphilus polymeriproducens]|uniref:tRNA (guanine-N(7)-)-methyltransferase n=1 Tax=Anaerosacchariphilus polymeriproducens TaxID=1812858 RepID=A0A371AVF6_9FIRM|nr:tRNA (guanosine(46)-N7)-methyltransferase TrmB [Anaerosacchariphilus polymeriproducens]RDU23564.1 tRNA (guanosine(46)-N7)-methyltransferase TrmB [Anaerosacchariphilus polymeriproducens]
MRLRNIPGAEEVINNCQDVIQNPEQYKGNWKEVFDNQNPIFIEIGMGKGQFLMKMAELNPKINYIGIEKYTSVMLRAVQKLNELEVTNLKLICMDAEEIMNVFGMEEINNIYLNFSDPWPKDRHAKRRLTSKEFLDRYDKVLHKGGKIEFKTDNRNLFEFSLEEIKQSSWKLEAYTFDLHNDEILNFGNIMTEYEEKFSSEGNPIHKLIAYR